MEEGEIRLTPNMLKALGESTKLSILRVLSSGSMIPTDIGKKLNKSTPTIVEHLEKLRNAGLVEKREQPGKKYVFYTLTETGKELIFNKSRLSIVLLSSVVLFLAGIVLLISTSYVRMTPQAAAAVQNSTSASAVPLSASASPVSLSLIAILILIVAFILLLVYARKLGQLRFRIGD